MAQPVTCDYCQQEQAILMQTSLGDGTVTAIGAGCLPVFFAGAAFTLMEAGEHAGPPSKCQACRRMHERMTTPVAPLSVPEAEPDSTAGDTEEPAETRAAE